MLLIEDTLTPFDRAYTTIADRASRWNVRYVYPWSHEIEKCMYDGRLTLVVGNFQIGLPTTVSHNMFEILLEVIG